jgi:hypothetical protein
VLRTGSILLLLMAPLSLLGVQDTAAQLKAEIVKKADKLIGAHYQPRPGEMLRHFDREKKKWSTTPGPDDSVIYRYGTSYVVILVFATDGSLAHASLFPEALLYSDSWSNVRKDIELSVDQMQWLVDTASKLQPLGKPVSKQTPSLCFQSGANHYCHDDYENGSADHYWRETYIGNGPAGKVALKEVSIAYKKMVRNDQ